MDEFELKGRIEKGEDLHTEFKQILPNVRTIAKSIVSFANTDGGHLIIGVAHRDYTIRAPIRLLVFNDRVEIRTPGKLPNTVTIESMKIGGAHVLRNPTIYNLLARMGMVTNLGSGVRRIIFLVKKHLNKDVQLVESNNEFILTIPRRT